MFKRMFSTQRVIGAYRFQSLGRDSGCSSLEGDYETETSYHRFNPSVGILGVQAPQRYQFPRLHIQVSIPRSGFWVFKLSRHGELRCTPLVSIPRSGFWVFKHAHHT